MTTARGDPGEDGSPGVSLRRKLVRRISGGASFVCLSAGLIWLLPNTLMADITNGAVFVVLGVLLFLSAVLFAERSEPSSRLVEIINAVRNRSSDP